MRAASADVYSALVNRMSVFGLVRINEFATVINHEAVAAVGKRRDAIRTVDIDEHLAQVLRQQRKPLGLVNTYSVTS